MIFLPHLGTRSRDDGSALILVLMVMVLVMALGSTIAAVTINDLLGSRRADEAGQVLNAAEAGLAQGITFVRANGIETLTCGTSDTFDSDNCRRPYGSGRREGPPTGKTGRASYAVWIEAVDPYTRKSGAEGKYVVHSIGFIGDEAPAECPDGNVPCRGVSAVLHVDSIGTPQGVFAQSLSPTGNGNATLIAQQIFTPSCFIHRNQLDTSDETLDPFYDIPAAVHAAGVITANNQNACDGIQGNSNSSIHAGGACDANHPWDQDIAGAKIDIDNDANTKCAPAVINFPQWYGDRDPQDPTDGVYGSKIDGVSAMMKAFNLQSSPLTNEQEERLTQAALDAGTLYTSVPTSTLPAAGVYFFDLTGQTSKKPVSVSLSTIPPPADPCHPPIVVVKNGNAVVDADVEMTLIMKVTGTSSALGAVSTSGKTTFTGSLHAMSLNLSGGSTLTQRSCAVENAPVQLLNVSVASQSEDQ